MCGGHLKPRAVGCKATALRMLPFVTEYCKAHAMQRCCECQLLSEVFLVYSRCVQMVKVLLAIGPCLSDTESLFEQHGVPRHVRATVVHLAVPLFFAEGTLPCLRNTVIVTLTLSLAAAAGMAGLHDAGRWCSTMLAGRGQLAAPASQSTVVTIGACSDSCGCCRRPLYQRQCAWQCMCLTLSCTACCSC